MNHLLTTLLAAAATLLTFAPMASHAQSSGPVVRLIVPLAAGSAGAVGAGTGVPAAGGAANDGPPLRGALSWARATGPVRASARETAIRERFMGRV